ncbi:hypothetical protein PH30N_02186 [Cutibacterium modestum 30N]|nr:hypothetical protein BCB70_10865 [Cutibacterium modestum]MCP2375114.1 hypothetical protein [Cutibacterium modestum 28N]MCP2379899.1 hypothetical protein [Cutibacterium modestum 30N]
MVRAVPQHAVQQWPGGDVKARPTGDVGSPNDPAQPVKGLVEQVGWAGSSQAGRLHRSRAAPGHDEMASSSQGGRDRLPAG